LILAPVEKIRNIKGVPHAMFTWMRKDLREINRGYDNYQSYPDKKDKFWCPISELFNVSGYKPGDFRIFFNDPRTRREYLKWSEILMANGSRKTLRLVDGEPQAISTAMMKAS